MNKLVKDEGVVLKKRSLLRKDLIVTIFSRQRGKLQVIAKGVKKITSRRLSHLETGNLIKIILRQQGERLYLQHTQLISGLTEIKSDSTKQSELYFYLFVLDRLMPENQKDFSVYQLYLKFIIELARSKAVSRVIMLSNLEKLLVDLGYLNSSDKKDNLLLYLQEIINEKLPEFII